MDFSQLKLPPNLHNKSILSIDYGTVAVGLASFCSGRDPFPLPAGRILYKNDDLLISTLLQKIEDECIEIIVLGLPLYSDQTVGPMAQKIQAFGRALSEQIDKNIQLFYQNEALTTFEAKEIMKSSPRYNFQVDPKKIDTLAACIILEEFIVEKTVKF